MESQCPEGQMKDASGTCVPIPAGGRRRTLKAKTLRRLLKKKGLKTTGKKSTLMKRLKMKGGYSTPLLGSMPVTQDAAGAVSGGRRRTRRSRRGLFGY
jgi:hypothetical protein